MKKLATASLFVIIFIAGCSSSSNDSQSGVSITATQPTAWEGSEDYLEFVIDLGSPNETAGNIIVYFEASGTALARSDVAGNTDLLNGYVEILQDSQKGTIRIGGFTSDGSITETQPITLRITGCSSTEYRVEPDTEATAIVMDGDGSTVTDIDENEYHTVLIGAQTWMAQNLNVEKFRNGDPIPEAKTPVEWINAGKNRQPAWCYYNNDPANGLKYGKLYNWYAIVDSRGLAPDGWRIPWKEDWTQLASYLGWSKDGGIWETAGKKMKSASGWYGNGNGTNESGFTGLPGSFRSGHDGSFGSIGKTGYWGMASAGNTSVIHYQGDVLIMHFSDERYGVSIRCLKNG